MTNAITKASGAAIEREGFGERGIERRNETAATAIAAQAQAEIQAMYIIAMQRPRDDDTVRVRLLKACRRTAFAERAVYAVPRRGAKPGRISGRTGVVEGLSVRFAEEAVRIAGNIAQRTRTSYDDDFKRMITVAAIDLETNAGYSRDVIVEKTVERREKRDGMVILGKRENSVGETVYIIQASEDEITTKEGALVSKVFRTLALRLIPADTLEECEREIVQTMRAEDDRDPDAARKRIADAFAALNVMPADVKMYLGHDLGQCSPTELSELRGLCGAIRDGEVTWAEALAEKRGPIVEAPAEGGEKKPAAKSIQERIEARAQQRKQQQAPAKPPAQADTPVQSAKTDDDELGGRM